MRGVTLLIGTLLYGIVGLTGSISVRKFNNEDERLIGWRGDTYKPQRDSLLVENKDLWIESIAWSPRAFIFHNIISDEEARHLVELAWPQMQRSTVVGENGSSVLDDYRTSYGTFLNRYQDEVVRAVEDRVALLTHTPVVHQEDIQVLRYGIGQYYHRHQDSLDNDSPRMATLLIYLSDPEEGGETSFPEYSEWARPEMAQSYGSAFSDCAKGHVAFKPRKGDGLLFWSTKPDGKTDDPASMHEGCPVIKGVKWTTTFWIHTLPFRPEEYNPATKRFREPYGFQDPGWCPDMAGEECKKWAAAGECEKNAHYMKGNGIDLGNCMRSCKVCEVCKGKEDKECYNRNRRASGYLVFDPRELDYKRPLGT